MTMKKTIAVMLAVILLLAGCSAKKEADHIADGDYEGKNGSNKAEELVPASDAVVREEDSRVVYGIDDVQTRSSVNVRLYRLNEGVWQLADQKNVAADGSVTVAFDTKDLSDGGYYELGENDILVLTVSVNDDKIEFSQKAGVSGVYSIYSLYSGSLKTDREAVVCYLVLSENRSLFTAFDAGWFSDVSSLPSAESSYQLFAVTVEIS